jgi:thiamine-phosphate pyrophosphorylase
MKLLAISDPEFIPDEAEIINSLFREGLVCMHIRKPASDENQFKALLTKIEPEFMDSIAIHQHHALAHDLGIQRLHFTEKDRKMTSEEKLALLRDAGYRLSTSIHDAKDLSGLSPVFSYTFLGPVFDSISKTDYKSAFSADFYLDEKTKRIPVIALGGIDITNLKKVKAMNFDGAAILGTLWKDPKSALNTFQKLIEVSEIHRKRTAPKGRHTSPQGPYPGLGE